MLSEKQLLSIVDKKISAAQKYDDETQKDDRELALEYYRGEMSDLEPDDGRSSAMSHDVADVIGWIMPGLMRIFCASDHVMEAVPVGPEDEDLAKQQTEGTNHIVMNECNGRQVIYNLCHNALLLRTGVAKFWWDQTKEYKIETLTLDADQFAQLADDSIEILEHTERGDGSHEVKTKVLESDGRLRLEAVPPEDFLISAEATSLDDANFACHKERLTRSELRQRFEGNERTLAKIDKLNTDGVVDEDADESREKDYSSEEEAADKATDEIEIYECYILVDSDEDGVAEWRQIVCSGGKGARVMLSDEEWDDDLPFAAITPEPIPHRFHGRSLADDTMDIQRIKTALLRGGLDNIYWQNNPEREVDVSMLDDDAIDLLNNRQFGNTIPTKKPGSVNYLTLPYFAENTFAALSQMDEIIEKRTGVSRATLALDPETLQNQTATAINAQKSASQSKVELIARNMAPGIKRMFKGCMSLIAKYESKEKVFRLRGQWVEVTPSAWELEMDVTVNVGLGGSTREQDIAILQMILGRQEQVIQEFGPDNPVVPFPKVLETFAKLIEASGLENPEAYFNDVPEQQLAQWFQQHQQKQGQGDPLKMKEIELKAQAQQAEIQLKREQMQAELKLKREQMMLELQMKREQAAFGAQPSGLATEINVGGQPG